MVNGYTENVFFISDPLENKAFGLILWDLGKGKEKD